MAKKKEQQFNAEEALKRREKYIKACESEKRGKAAVLSIIGFSLLSFIIVLVIVLKMTGVGTTIVFDSDGKEQTVYAEEGAQGTNLADYVADELAD